ncbi:MAG TPA: hypothetical protein VGG87_12825, partial [Solirubrobacteraceae bacterium]
MSEAPSVGAGDQPPAWDLSSVMPEGPSGAVDLGRQAVAAANTFADQHEGRIAAYGASELREALEQLEAIHAAMTLADAYATLRFDADTG